MADYKRIALLIIVMTAVVAASTAVALGLLYRTAYERERLHLIGSVRNQARMMESIARFDQEFLQDYPGAPGSAALVQIRDALSRQPGVTETAELTVARREGDMIVFLMRHRHKETGRPEPVPFASRLAEPMSRALSGQSGSMVGLDYHGETVLAAYEPVTSLGLGAVAKVDLAEIRGPFLRAGAMVVGVALVLVLAGTVLFVRVTNPMLLELRKSKRELELILASTGEGIFGMDVDGKCKFANRSALQMLGYEDAEELLGRDMHELIHHTRPDGTPHLKADCPVLRALRNDRTIHLQEETLWRADGSSFPAEYRAYPMRREDEVVGTVATFVDITERKAKELQLIHAQKMEVLGQLTGGIAHDFNNLLTIILGNLRLLAEDIDASPDTELRELVNDALSASQDGADLTQRLLAFSRKQTLRPSSIDVNAFVRDSRRFLSRVMGEDVDVRLDLDESILPILVDPQQLHSALLNLIINSRDAMPDGGRLVISTGRHSVGRSGEPNGVAPGDYVVVSVTDTGAGMSRDAAQRAVEPFFTTKAPSEGSGLGLSIVYGFAQQSGGGVEITSAPGVGTTVSLLLPQAVAGSQDQSGQIEDSGPLANGEMVLVVEDEPRLRAFAARSLTALGFKVIGAGDAEEARRILRSDVPVTVLFSDIVMPGDMDGRALARWALRGRPGIRVLLTTGFSDELRLDHGYPDRTPVLPKPYSKQTLRAAMRDVLRARKTPPRSHRLSAA